MVGGRGAARLITLTTDFGAADGFVAAMKGVIARRAPGTPTVDVTHEIPPQDVYAGAFVLRAVVPWFPAGTVHVAVVDPGVGTMRRALCIETDRGRFVGPDNGVLSLAAPPEATRRAVALVDSRWFLPTPSKTFHGRDVFAPVAAALAMGVRIDRLGPAVEDPICLESPAPVVEAHGLRGAVAWIDRFGNLVTNVGGADVAGRAASVAVGATRIPSLSPTYGAVPPDALLALVNSWGFLEIAVRGGSARDRLDASPGTPVRVLWEDG